VNSFEATRNSPTCALFFFTDFHCCWVGQGRALRC